MTGSALTRWTLRVEPEAVIGRESEGGSGFGIALGRRPGGFSVLWTLLAPNAQFRSVLVVLLS